MFIDSVDVRLPCVAVLRCSLAPYMLDCNVFWVFFFCEVFIESVDVWLFGGVY